MDEIERTRSERRPCIIIEAHGPHTYRPVGEEHIVRCPGVKPLIATMCGSEERHNPHAIDETSFCIGF
jgi:hypothetical protein